ncbi:MULTISPECIES: hypothetical protein [unclassified Plantibacter]|jgi:hypothetical protein|uniref:hypothetical protein n=1 Tax=unclassified Plantibacter TaxID=2624265 RepID=UPI003D349D6C
MELLFVVLGAAIIGLAARYLLPQRDQHGAALIPAIATAAAAIVWVALTWAGMPWDGAWIWVITFVASALTAVAADLVLGRVRTAKDAELLERLQKAPVVV